MSDESLRREVEALKAQLQDARLSLSSLIEARAGAQLGVDDGLALLQDAEAALHRNERLMRAIFQGALDAIILVDRHVEIADANPAACELFGRKREELVGRPLAAFARVSMEVVWAWQELLNAGRLKWELTLERPDGSTRCAEFSTAANVLPGLDLAILRDVTESKQIRETLRLTEERLHTIVSSAPVVLSAFDREGTYLLSEGKGLARIGRKPGELVGTNIFEILRIAPGAEAMAEKALAGETVTGQAELHGAVFDVLMTPMLGPSGEVVGAISVSLDITERARAEQAQRRAEVSLREQHYFNEEAQAVAQVGSWAVLGIDEDRQAFWSKETYRILGIPESEPARPSTFFARIHPEDQATVREAARRVWEGGTPYEAEHRIVRPNGEVRWVYARATTREVGESTERRLVGILQDVTERHVVTAERRAAEEKYRRIVEGTSEGVWLIDAGGITSFVNARMAEMLGYSREEMLGRSLDAFMDAESVASIESKLARGRTGASETHEHRYQRKDGSCLWALVKSNPFFDARGNYDGSLALITDISERLQMEGVRNQLAALVESSDDAINGTDRFGIITSWNRAAERLYGYTAHEAIGQPIEFLLPAERAHEEREILARVAANEPVPAVETTRRRKDGALVEVSISAWPVRNSAGQAAGSGRIARDLTEWRRAAGRLRRAEEQLRQAQKMEAIGSLAGGVAHDFNNLLSIILTFGGLALEQLPVGSPARPDLEHVANAAQRAASLTRQLLTFSRQQILEPQVVDVNLRVSGLQALLSRLLGEHIRLRIALSAKVGRVYADPGQVDQVLMNLAVNARDAMPDGGTLLIETSNVVLDSGHDAEHPEIKPGAYVLLSVTDSGTGIAQATLQRIFEPFFTTKEPGKGTGLGLSTVFGIVTQSGGHVSVASELGRGSTFKVYLPQTDRVARTTSIPPPVASSGRGGETVMVVEDDDTLRAAVRAVLSKQGYRVLEAQNGAEALLICQQYRPRIDLLLTDVVMPRMSGRELVAQLAPTRADLKVLYMSGYAENTVVLHGVLDTGFAYLAKPVTPDALLRKVREVLEGRTSRYPGAGPD